MRKAIGIGLVIVVVFGYRLSSLDTVVLAISWWLITRAYESYINKLERGPV